jgi:hypothetical protein
MMTRNPMRFLHMGCGEPLLGPARGFAERRRLAAQQPKPVVAQKRRSTDR